MTPEDVLCLCSRHHHPARATSPITRSPSVVGGMRGAFSAGALWRFGATSEPNLGGNSGHERSDLVRGGRHPPSSSPARISRAEPPLCLRPTGMLPCWWTDPGRGGTRHRAGGPKGTRTPDLLAASHTPQARGMVNVLVADLPAADLRALPPRLRLHAPRGFQPLVEPSESPNARPAAACPRSSTSAAQRCLVS